MPPEVAAAFARYPEPVSARLLEIRQMIFDCAGGRAAVGPITETLRWGEPAYLTVLSKSGTTIRLGQSKSAPEGCAVFFNCQTSLVEEFRMQFGDVLRFEKKRAIILPHDQPLFREALQVCIGRALRYHWQERSARGQRTASG